MNFKHLPLQVLEFFFFFFFGLVNKFYLQDFTYHEKLENGI